MKSFSSLMIHDNPLDLIDSFLRREHPRFRLASAHVGSLGGLMALKRHQCHLAGSHLLNDADGVYNRQALRDISPHATLIYRKFVEFISRHDFTGAALLDRTLEPVMLVGQGWQGGYPAAREAMAWEPCPGRACCPSGSRGSVCWWIFTVR